MRISSTKSQLQKVGEKLRHKVPLTELEECVLAEFRLGHRNIIEAFRNHHKVILDKAKWREKGILFASRLKKRQTLINKLSDRHREMDLTRMHDIAGCRLIFLNLADVLKYRDRFRGRLVENKHFKLMDGCEKYDYISCPRKTTGYRGIHDVYVEETEDNIKAKIEVQYRTVTQHAWATALEIWDQSHLHGAKFGLEDPQVQRLFCLYSELLWRRFDFCEGFSRDTLNLSDEELYKGIRDGERMFGVLRFLSELPPVCGKLGLRGGEEEILLHRYVHSGAPAGGIVARQLTWDAVRSELFKRELDDANDLVFVLAKPKVLKKVYNNYFDDAGGFIKKVRRAMTDLYNSRSFRYFRHDLDPVFRIVSR